MKSATSSKRSLTNRLLEPTVLWLWSTGLRFVLKGKVLWVKDPNQPHVITFAGRIEEVSIKRPAGRPELVARCVAIQPGQHDNLETREFFLTLNLHRIEPGIWGTEQ